MENVSILGCGWLGKPLAINLINNGYKVKGSTTSNHKIDDFKSLKIIPFIVDILLDNDVDNFLDSDILIIAITSKNVIDFKRLISKIEKSPIKKVLFISSTSVYPSLNKEMREEDKTVNSPLVEIENLFLKNVNFKTTIIRFAGLYGYDRQPGNWFKDRKIPHPKGFVNMIHQDDCILVIKKIIAEDVFGEVFNVCSNHHPTREEFYTNARKVLQKEAPVFDNSMPLKFKIINSEKVQRVLKYTFIHDNLLSI
ncbi:NAD(P)-binding domain-containing protein [Tenacibaculum sp. nBUS_03]|uniref:NAD(P)-binding domain-containing protein n=1 Tax=Tenacibaculum sp. nBUS_03 TaxID=3395320 RepID=UPI003EB6CDED